MLTKVYTSKMGSKKLKRKKIKGKKIVKLTKIYKLKREKCKCLKDLKKSVCRKSLQQNLINRNRLIKENNYSRFSLDEKYISNVKHFAQLREQYFTYLQQIVSENCIFCNFQLKEDTLENISLKLEQHALLASLQANIYEKSILNIINDIEKSTCEKQINEKVKQLLPEFTCEDIIHIKTEKAPSLEIISEIPTISNTENIGETYNENENECINNFNSGTGDFSHENSVILNLDESNSQNNEENCTNVKNITNDQCSKIPETSQNNCNKEDQLEVNEFLDFVPMSDDESEAVTQAAVEELKEDFFCENQEQIQQPKPVDLSPSKLDGSWELSSEEKERAYIAHILEGEDSDDDENRLGSLSDNDNNSKENVNDTNLMSRLKKMKEIFGVDDDECNMTAMNKPKVFNHKVSNQSNTNRRFSVWKHEKVIQQYKYSMISSEMILEKRIRNKKLFLELFGNDSDDEYELENQSEEKFKTSCRERISPWVVKYLMPFYSNKKIIGKNTFKSLGHHISNSIIDEILYPDEWSVKYFVSKFFPPKKKYFCDEDVTMFNYE